MKRTPSWLIVGCVCIAIAVGQLIGVQRFSFGIVTIVLLPLVFAFIAGLLLNPAVVAPLQAVVGEGAGQRAARLVSPAVMPLIVVLTAGIGPQMNALIEAGPALL
ncbi:MAG: DUF3100 domain-containing protein, partial [Pseudomonadota bacterium]